MAGAPYGLLGTCCCDSGGSSDGSVCGVDLGTLYLWFETTKGSLVYTDGPHSVAYDATLGGWFYELLYTDGVMPTWNTSDCSYTVDGYAQMLYGIKCYTSGVMVARCIGFKTGITSGTPCFYKQFIAGGDTPPWTNTGTNTMPDITGTLLAPDYNTPGSCTGRSWYRLGDKTGSVWDGSSNLLLTLAQSDGSPCVYVGVKVTRTTTAP
jgi:hypothetical protein